MGVKINGLKDLQRNLEKLEKKASSTNGTHSVSFIELFNKGFMESHTDFSDIEQFVEKSGFDFSDMESIDETELDSFVNENSVFDSWNSMKSKAAGLWTKKQLGL